MKLRLGISTCPNDTFAFHAILNRKVDLGGLEFETCLCDVQELNELLEKGELDIAKASFHAALHLADRYGVIRSGSALGEGVGPLLLAGKEGTRPNANSRVLCPGAWTTATLLFKCFFPEAQQIEHRVFSELMTETSRGNADFCVVIHEGRFTFEQEGLFLVEDLGSLWEEESGQALPLGGILARRDLRGDIPARFHRLLQQSIEYAYAHRDEAMRTVRLYAQELDEHVIAPYLELYVNEHTVDLGEVGKNALLALEAKARATGAIAKDAPPLVILG